MANLCPSVPTKVTIFLLLSLVILKYKPFKKYLVSSFEIANLVLSINLNKIFELVEFLAHKKSNKINGKLISAIWDNWKVFDKKINIFKNSEFGTLRRISGKDRKLNIFDK